MLSISASPDATPLLRGPAIHFVLECLRVCLALQLLTTSVVNFFGVEKSASFWTFSVRYCIVIRRYRWIKTQSLLQYPYSAYWNSGRRSLAKDNYKRQGRNLCEAHDDFVVSAVRSRVLSLHPKDKVQKRSTNACEIVAACELWSRTSEL